MNLAAQKGHAHLLMWVIDDVTIPLRINGLRESLCHIANGSDDKTYMVKRTLRCPRKRDRPHEKTFSD